MGKILTIDERAKLRPCLRCGYSLRSNLDAKRCPECGLTVWLSLTRNNALDMSNPDWLRRMTIGSWVLGIACVCWALLLSVWVVQCFAYYWGEILLSPMMHLRFALPVIGAIGVFGAAWYIPSERRWPDKHAATRIGVIVAVVLFAIGVLAFAWFIPWRGTWRAMYFGQAISQLPFDILLIATLLHVIERLNRGFHRRLSRWISWVFVAHLLDLVLAIVWGSIMLRPSRFLRSVFSVDAPSIWFPLKLSIHSLMALLAAVSLALAARRFSVDRRSAIRAWAE
jgi:hypothetical protein